MLKTLRKYTLALSVSPAPRALDQEGKPFGSTQGRRVPPARITWQLSASELRVQRFEVLVDSDGELEQGIRTADLLELGGGTIPLTAAGYPSRVHLSLGLGTLHLLPCLCGGISV